MRKVANHSDAVRGYAALLTLASLLLSLLVLQPDRVVAQTNWNVATGSWTDPANWTLGVPNSLVDAYIDNGGTSRVDTPDAEAKIVRIGNAGNGTLEITGGGILSNTTGRVGVDFDSMGVVTVIGEGSHWSNSSDLDVGFRGQGYLSISDGARVTSSGFSTEIGYLASEGLVTVSGINSVWTNSSTYFDIGDGGSGELVIEDGGRVSSSSFSRIGYFSGSIGNATVTGQGSLWTSLLSLDIGHAGSGELTIAAGGRVSSNSSTIGANSSPHAKVTVSGGGSTWSNGSLTVGRKGLGEFGDRIGR